MDLVRNLAGTLMKVQMISLIAYHIEPYYRRYPHDCIETNLRRNIAARSHLIYNQNLCVGLECTYGKTFYTLLNILYLNCYHQGNQKK